MNKQQQQQQQGYGHGHGDSSYCCFHPRELVVGVCPHCLKARLLLLLAAKDDVKNPHPIRRRSRSRTTTSTSSISLPKVFALGSSFLQRLDSRGHYTHRTDADAAAAAAAPNPNPNPNPNDGNCSDDTTSVASLDDSFISIKFEDNGKATWDSPHKQQHQVVIATTKQTNTVVMVPEHARRGGVTRWRKQVVGRLLQLARWNWKRSKAASTASHVGLDGKKQDGSKASRGRAGWIRSLTRRRAAAAHGDRAWS
ncbi:hypothetical protein BS78_06G294300 [Paspalum vaginatum]|nr:hypothetical protein BS78_06G294300 [Paspalum vaginatum]KAJ1273597.1 hypothetical protein BS78_06G294300 [Paspalum vaginatum]KAJ1273598.1 hypothetical protein BS78_06G294300 [Paspalum vaginatum]